MVQSGHHLHPKDKGVPKLQPAQNLKHGRKKSSLHSWLGDQLLLRGKLSDDMGTNRESQALQITCLDLANAFGSVPYQLVTFVLEFFHVYEASRS